MKQGIIIHEIEAEDIRAMIREELTAIFQIQQKDSETTDSILSAEEAAKFTKRSLATIYRQVSNREIPYHKNGNRLYFFKSELIEWITDRKSE
jgi:excisionase family DNA binding protein